MSKQTTVQKDAAIRQGSVKVLIGDDFNSLTDIGALRNPVISSLIENQEIPFDNVRELRKYVDGKKIQVTFELAEINLTNIAELDSGLITLTTTAASEVSGAEQSVSSGAWSFNSFIAIANQNGDGTSPTVNSVTAGTDGALVEDTDFYVGQDSNGVWGIFVIDSATVTTESQELTINYDYTPAASKKITFAEDGTKGTKVMRLINTDNDGNEFRVDIEDGTNFTPISIDWAGDDEDDVAVLPIDFQGYIKEVVDEQQTT